MGENTFGGGRGRVGEKTFGGGRGRVGERAFGAYDMSKYKRIEINLPDPCVEDPSGQRTMDLRTRLRQLSNTKSENKAT